MVPGVRLTEITAPNGLLKGLRLISFSLLEQGIDPDRDFNAMRRKCLLNTFCGKLWNPELRIQVQSTCLQLWCN